ncbi:MAG TPA: carboxypeptidase-like regulatory domain-containing protein, partial [Puia sp.]
MKSRKLANATALAFLSLLLLSSPLSAQTVSIKGVVYDKLNKPISDVTVEVAGLRRGTATDTMGRFSITLDNTKQQLRFSHIGYITQTTTINNSLALEIFMDAEVGSENEVVVVGYGKQRKISQIGAQSSVNIEDLKQPIANVSAGLAGRLGGLIAVQRQGEPGHDDADLWIRGIASLNDSRPLILIDGVERSMSNLNYDDIASFSILKDASATAVYGVRGANGVVLITTRQGKAGKPRFNFDIQTGITTFTRIPKLTDGLTYMKMANEALTTRGGTPKYDQDYIDSTAAGKDP